MSNKQTIYHSLASFFRENLNKSYPWMDEHFIIIWRILEVLVIVYVYKNPDGFFSDLFIYTTCSIDRFYTCLHYVNIYKDS